MADNQIGRPKKGNSRPPYKHQAWPKMVYNGKTGEQLVVNSKKEYPEDHVAELVFVGKTKKQITEIKTERRISYETGEALAAKERGDDDSVPTLEELGFTGDDLRGQALELLAEEGVRVPKKASDDEIALLAQKALEDVNG